MKKIFLFLMMSAFIGKSYAQPKHSFELTAGPVATIPIGTFGDHYSVGFGGTVQGIYNLKSVYRGWPTDSTQVSLIAEAGYEHYGGEDYTIGTQTFPGDGFGLIPVTAGVQWTFIPHLYVSGQAGVALPTASGGSTDFHYLLGLGYGFHAPFTVDVRYSGYSDNGNTSSAVNLAVHYIICPHPHK